MGGHGPGDPPGLPPKPPSLPPKPPSLSPPPKQPQGKEHWRSIVAKVKKEQPSTENLTRDPNAPNVRFITEVNEESIRYAVHAPISGKLPDLQPHILLFADGSNTEGDSYTGGGGVAFKLLHGNTYEWRMEKWSRQSFGFHGIKDSHQAEFLIIHFALRIALFHVTKWLNMPSNQNKAPESRPVVIIASDSGRAIKEYEALYKGGIRSQAPIQLPTAFSTHILGPLQALEKSGIKIDFRVVPAHTEIEGNDLADNLAKVGRWFAQVVPQFIGHSSGNSVFSISHLYGSGWLGDMEITSANLKCDGYFSACRLSTAGIYTFLFGCISPRGNNHHVLEMLKEAVDEALHSAKYQLRTTTSLEDPATSAKTTTGTESTTGAEPTTMTTVSPVASANTVDSMTNSEWTTSTEPTTTTNAGSKRENQFEEVPNPTSKRLKHGHSEADTIQKETS
ncbi:hypothetical protein F5Y16DRAFT_401434 [Xylariaceae sp. FL0255]|nr:hypothetical protein F5Y16DRAFT_401434 [Xylariaceae sp. FL0255]